MPSSGSDIMGEAEKDPNCGPLKKYSDNRQVRVPAPKWEKLCSDDVTFDKVPQQQSERFDNFTFEDYDGRYHYDWSQEKQTNSDTHDETLRAAEYHVSKGDIAIEPAPEDDLWKQFDAACLQKTYFELPNSTRDQLLKKLFAASSLSSAEDKKNPLVTVCVKLPKELIAEYSKNSTTGASSAHESWDITRMTRAMKAIQEDDKPEHIEVANDPIAQPKPIPRRRNPKFASKHVAPRIHAKQTGVQLTDDHYKKYIRMCTTSSPADALKVALVDRCGTLARAIRMIDRNGDRDVTMSELSDGLERLRIDWRRFSRCTRLRDVLASGGQAIGDMEVNLRLFLGLPAAGTSVREMAVGGDWSNMEVPAQWKRFLRATNLTEKMYPRPDGTKETNSEKVNKMSPRELDEVMGLKPNGKHLAAILDDGRRKALGDLQRHKHAMKKIALQQEHDRTKVPKSVNKNLKHIGNLRRDLRACSDRMVGGNF